MSLYCIGDLHGRFDLFRMALDKVDFDYCNDKMFILGDVIDGGKEAIRIIQYILDHPKSFELILGNHERHFIDMLQAYDAIMLDDGLRQEMVGVMSYYSGNLYNQIAMLVKCNLQFHDIQKIRCNQQIIDWLKVSSKRERILNSILSTIEYIHFDENVFSKIMLILSNADGMFKTKPFVKELLELNRYEYVIVRDFIVSRQSEIKFEYLGRNFWLKHSSDYYHYMDDHDLPPISKNWCFVGRSQYCSIFHHIPDLTTTNIYLITGHDPVPAKIHRPLHGSDFLGYQYYRTIFDFNYRAIFSYIDSFNNHYYNLDLGSNPVGILRLNDLEEFYVGVPTQKQTSWEIPQNTSIIKRRSYSAVEGAEFYSVKNNKLINYKINKRGFTFVSYKDCCYEFLIGVNSFKKEIYYTRIDFLDTYYCQVIKGWYRGQPIDKIVEKVILDFDSKKQSSEQIAFERSIRLLK